MAARRRNNFRQTDVARALKGVLAAGIKVGRVEIAQDGRIVIVSGEGGAPEPMNELDRWKAGRDARAP